MSNWNKIKRYAGMAFGRPAVVGGAQINRKIRNWIRSGYKSTRDPPKKGTRRPLRFSKFGGRRRYGKRLRPKMRRMKRRAGGALYRTILSKGLTQPATELSATSGNISSIQDNIQGNCSWYSMPMETTPAIFDRILSASQNLAITGVSIVQEVFLDTVKVQLNMRNNSSQDCNVQIYKCTPRIDLATASGIYGSDPTLFTSGITSLATEAKATSLPNYYDQNVTPYMSATWCSMFKIKPLVKRFLKPGEEIKLRRSRKVGYVIKKSKYGIATGESFAGVYDHLKRNGPIYLIKVTGSIVHDESTISYPLQSGTSTKVTYGGFNVDWVQNVRINYRCPFVTPTRVLGQYTELPSNLLRTNADQYLANVAGETAGEA